MACFRFERVDPSEGARTISGPQVDVVLDDDNPVVETSDAAVAAVLRDAYGVQELEPAVDCDGPEVSAHAPEPAAEQPGPAHVPGFEGEQPANETPADERFQPVETVDQPAEEDDQ